ncbi:unnamed protein product [Adineta ricciae]|uniref:Uncharacterized protein n=1 Tax=Adineta ricciae TaxID=249248 RepID=A0A814CZ69_ADIRI|nr:unnamed protein product [Adineta ricciae]CAF1200384.1 unnamed protein product [Adineta ricciae]
MFPLIAVPSNLSFGTTVKTMLQILTIETANRRFLTYDIHHMCKTTNNCARHFVEQKISQMQNRSYNRTDIYSSLQRLLFNQSTLSENLACCNMSNDIRQCSILDPSVSCHVIDDLIRLLGFIGVYVYIIGEYLLVLIFIIQITS